VREREFRSWAIVVVDFLNLLWLWLILSLEKKRRRRRKRKRKSYMGGSL